MGYGNGRGEETPARLRKGRRAEPREGSGESGYGFDGDFGTAVPERFMRRA